MVGVTLLLVTVAVLTPSSAAPFIEGVRQRCYAVQRDLNLAFLVSIGNPSVSQGLLHCPADTGDMQSLQSPSYPEAFTYAIDQVNSDPNLLPNISLGFIILDYCEHDLAGLAVSLYLIPDKNDSEHFADNELLTCADGYKRFRNVVGTVGPGYSRLAVMNVPLLSVNHIPMLLTFATSDDLSDKSRFPYSMRLVPPDRFQADAMTDLLLHFGWSYVSLLYMEGSYGENGAKQLQKNAKKKGICIAFAYMFPSILHAFHITEATEKMMQYKTARVVLAILSLDIPGLIAEELISKGMKNHFLWVGSDSFKWDKERYGQFFDGAFTVHFSVGQSPSFRSYYHSLTLQRSSNPWLPYIWKNEGSCTQNATSDDQSCKALEDIPSDVTLDSQDIPEIAIDGVAIYAHALHDLIEATCPEAFQNKSIVEECVKGELLLRYLHNTSINGFLGPIRFDNDGDFLGSYQLKQYHHDTGESVVGAVWNRLTGSLTVNTYNIKWFSYAGNDSLRQMVPESLCSRPCDVKEYYILKELPCCWECRKCRDNEIIVRNYTGCEQCDLLSWPDEESATYCVRISPTVLEWHDPLSLGIIALTCIGVLLCLLTAIVFIKNRHVRIVKASSHQLMTVILTGIMVAFTTSLVFLSRPSTASCVITRFGFNVATSLIYGPLLVKTSRVYRIFAAGKQGTRKPILVSSKSQIIMVGILLLVQLSLCMVSVFIAHPEPVYRMPVVTERYVEVQCNLPIPALMTPLSFNILLSIICAVFGFMTRRLPANFNESWYIFVSVATVTFLWLVFLPAYFTAFYAIHQTVLLVSCLLINGIVTLFCLYLPKMYCIYFVDESSLEYQSPGTMNPNAVAPAAIEAVASVSGHQEGLPT